MKIVYVLLTIILVIVGFSLGYFSKNEKDSIVTDFKNIEYVIEGQKVKLENDIKYFGNDLQTDLNEDGREDIVFLVTKNSEGTGTFYYALAALNIANGYIGSDGYFLGDRISPQTIEVSKNPRHRNVVVINYADRLPTEPMVAEPTVGKSAYLKLDTETMQWGVVVADFEGESR